MNVTWVVENIAKEQSFRELAEAVEKAGYPLVKLNGDYRPGLVQHLDGQCVIFNGSINMTKLVKETIPNAYPFAYSNWKKFLCQSYYPHFVDYLFNDNVIWTTLEQFYKKKWLYYGCLGKEGMVFIRPDSGEKTFQAQLLDIQNIESFYTNHKDLANEMVVIASPKNINGEWRVVVSKTEVIALSCYRYHGLITKVPSAPKEVVEFAEKLLTIDYHPDPVYCLDICLDSDDQPWLMELTSFSSAGLYACNKDQIVKRVSEIVLNDFTSHVL